MSTDPRRMYRMLKKIIVNIGLVMLSVGITFAISEISFRGLLFSNLGFMDKFRDSSLYASHASNDYWKLQYYFDSAHKPPKKPHPLLGWVPVVMNSETYAHTEFNHIGHRRPVLLYGDSFAGCATSDGPCFQHFLNTDKEFSQIYYFLNYGVGGYGFDQIFLLLKNSVHLYEDPLVVVSLMTGDIDRSLLSVRTGQKPYFEVLDDQLVLRGVPINPNPDTFFRENPPEIKSYLFRLWFRSQAPPWRLRLYLDNDAESERRQKAIQVCRNLILATIKELEERHIKYVFLIFNESYEIGREDNWKVKFLKQLLTDRHAQLLLAKDIIQTDAEQTLRTAKDYYIGGEGHPNSYQNELIATHLKRMIMK
jgi:hypothetical protein